MMRYSLLIAVTLAAVFVGTATAQDSSDRPRQIPPCQLTSIDGQSIEIAANSNRAHVIVFLGTECPLAKLYGPRIQAIANSYAADTAQVIGVFPNIQDSEEDVRQYIDDYEIRFPCVMDPQNTLVDLFKASRTPEAFVLDDALRIQYHGRIDDQYMPGISRPEANREDLAVALQETLDRRPVSIAETEVVGCLIGRYRKRDESGTSQPVRFTNQVIRILQEHCIECHRDGEIGPFVLDDYDEVVGWADMMMEVIDEGRMPPWHADPSVGTFRNERIMPEEDKRTLRQWVEAGAPFGDISEMPEPRTFTTGWRLPRDPDAIFQMSTKPFTVPADGTVEYQYFVVDPGFTEDKWVVAAEVIPGNRRVVHHSIVFIRPPDGDQFRGVGWLSAYVPGQSPGDVSAKRARRISAGSKLVFQQHYTPVGREQTDMTKIGLVFGDENEIEEEIFTLIAINQDFEIPPNAINHKVRASVPWIPKRAKLLSVSPHMHWRGKSFELTAQADGDSEVRLASVPKYDFNWQHSYEFRDSISLDEIRKLNITMAFDNSSDNPVNPNPEQVVTWGDQTWEEMAVAFFDISHPRVTGSESIVFAADTSSEQDSDPEERVERFVKEFFERFDKNADGKVSRDETPNAIKHFGFWEFDSDQDQALSRDEIKAAAQRRFR